jgi:hypothetical protein
VPELNLKMSGTVPSFDFGMRSNAGKRSLQSVIVAVNGRLVVDDLNLLIRAAIDEVGRALMSEDRAAPHLRVEHSCAWRKIGACRSPGFSSITRVGSSSRRHSRALIDTLRM